MKSQEKTIKILVEMPSKWVDFESPMGLAMYSLKDKLTRLLEEKVIDKAVSKMKIPKITVTPEEIKDKMLDILARKALENKDEL